MDRGEYIGPAVKHEINEYMGNLVQRRGQSTTIAAAASYYVR